MRFAPLPLLVGAVAVLHRLDGRMPAPAAADPATAAMVGMRYAALAIGWYLIVATLLGTGARLCGWARATAVIDAASPPFARRLAHASAGAALVVVTLAGATPVGAVEEEPPVLRHLPEEHRGFRAATNERPPSVASVSTGTTTTTMPTTSTTAPPTTSTTTSTITSTTSSTTTTTTTPRAPAPPSNRAPTTTTVAVPPRMQAPRAADVPPVRLPSWKVRPGDHLWSIAQRHVEHAWGRRPSPVELAPYWQEVVEANRPRLADPANPDLIFPGQVLVLPTPPAPRR